MVHEQIEPISKLEKVSKVIEQVGSVGEENIGNEPNPATFSQLMNDKTIQAQALEQSENKAAQKPTPIDSIDNAQRRIVHNQEETKEHHQVIHSKDDEWNGLIADTERAADQVKTLKEQLSTQTIEPSRPLRTSMQRTLIHLNDSLKIALSKVGVDYTPPTAQAPGLVAPLQKFLGYLSNSQEQLETLGTTLSDLHAGDKSITPANMLALQLKMGVITQQIEFFSSLLNKSLESTKTIMNVQV